MIYTYGGPYIVNFVDISFPFNTWSDVVQLHLAWSPINLGENSTLNSFAIPFDSAYLPLYFAGTPPWFNQLVVNSLALGLSGFGMFRLLAYLGRDWNDAAGMVGPIAAGIFYMFGVVGPEVLYWDFIPIGPIAEAALPFLILILVKQFDKLRANGKIDWMNVGWLGILSLFTFGANEPLAVGITIVYLGFVISETTSWVVSRNAGSSRRNLLMFLLLALGLPILVNAFWILPEIFQAGSGTSALASSPVYSGSLGDYQAYTSRLSVVWGIELRGLQPAIYEWFNPIFNESSIGSLLLLPAAVLLFLPLLGIRRIYPAVNRGRVLCITIILLVLVWLYAGVNAPLSGGISGPVAASPYLVALLRNTGASLALGITFIEAGLVGFATGVIASFIRTPPDVTPGTLPRFNRLKSKNSRRRKSVSHAPASFARIVPAAVVLAIILPGLTPAITGYLIPQSPYHATTELPEPVAQVSAFVDSHSGGAYTLLFPGGFQEQNFSGYGGHGYLGYDILADTIRTPVILDAGGGLGGPPNALITTAYADLALPPANVSFATLLSTLGVRLVVLESGVGDQYPWLFITDTNITRAKAFLEAQPFISEVATYGPYQVFENHQDLPGSVFLATGYSNVTARNTSLTNQYLNSSQLIGNNLLLSPLGDHLAHSGWINVSVAEQEGGLPFPGYAMLYNEVPLNVSTAEYSSLSVTFATGEDTAVMFQVSGVTALNSQNFSEDWYGTWPYSSPFPNGRPNFGWYYSYGNETTATIDIASLLSYLGASGATAFGNGFFNFLGIQLAPTEGNSTEVIAPGSPPRNLSLDLIAVRIAVPFYIPQANEVASNLISPHASNMTSTFANDVDSNNSTSLAPPLNASYSSGAIEVRVNMTTQGNNLTYPGYPTTFNRVPLAIPLGFLPCLSLTLQTSSSTAIQIGLSTESSLNESFFPNVWADPSDYTYPSYPGGLVYAPTHATTIVINALNAIQAKYGSSQSESAPDLNFIYLNLVRWAPNASELSVSITAISAANLCSISSLNPGPVSSLDSRFTTEPPLSQPFDPSTTAILAGAYGSMQLDPTASLYASQQSSVLWQVTVRNATGTLVIVLLQNFADGWTLKSDSVSLRVMHLIVDGYANAWIVESSGSHSNMSLTLYFAPQSSSNEYDAVSAITLGGSLLAILLTFAQRVIYRRRHRHCKK